jgi:hypothetical protein
MPAKAGIQQERRLARYIPGWMPDNSLFLQKSMIFGKIGFWHDNICFAIR